LRGHIRKLVVQFFTDIKILTPVKITNITKRLISKSYDKNKQTVLLYLILVMTLENLNVSFFKHVNISKTVEDT